MCKEKSIEVVRMFQNIEKGFKNGAVQNEDVKLFKFAEIKELMKKFFVKQNIVLYFRMSLLLISWGIWEISARLFENSNRFLWIISNCISLFSIAICFIPFYFLSLLLNQLGKWKKLTLVLLSIGILLCQIFIHVRFSGGA